MSEERRFGRHDYKRIRRAHANLAGLDQQQCEGVLALLTERDAELERRAAYIKQLCEVLDYVREYAEARVDADCTGDPPRFIGNDWSTIVNVIDEGPPRQVTERDAAPCLVCEHPTHAGECPVELSGGQPGRRCACYGVRELGSRVRSSRCLSGVSGRAR